MMRSECYHQGKNRLTWEPRTPSVEERTQRGHVGKRPERHIGQRKGREKAVQQAEGTPLEKARGFHGDSL